MFLRREVSGLIFPSLKNFLPFVVIHIVKGFSIVSEAEICITISDLVEEGSQVAQC